jgi:multidrug efflux pump
VTGQFYRQFAVTIAASVLISAFNSLTLSPALAAVLLKPHGAPKDALARGIDRVFGRFFAWFNAKFKRGSDRYSKGIGGTIKRSSRLLIVYAVLVGVTVLGFFQIPGGFIPTQDKQYLFAGVQLPEGATLERTEAAMKRIGEIALDTPGVADVVQFPGLNAIHFVSTPNVGVMFIGLDPPGDLPKPAAAIAGELTGKFGAMQDGLAFAFMPPPVNGFGNAAGVEAYVQDRQRIGYGELNASTQAFTGTISQQPGFGQGSAFSSFQSNVPQLDAVVNRDKVKESGLALTDVYNTLQVYLGSAYVNDFNLFGRTYSVYAQADAPFRDDVGDVARLQVRNAQGEMVPLGSVVDMVPTFGPDPVIRYNGYPAADVSASPFDPMAVSTTDAVRIARETAAQVLPRGMALEFTGLTYQQVNQGLAQYLVFPLCVLLVYLVLAALYESWSLPLAVILIVPMCMLSAFGGIYVLNAINGLWFGVQIGLGWINPMTAAPPTIIDMNVFTQIGLVVLMGLACKNAILIVEFARDLEKQGRGIVEAAIEACRLRLRPILMTSFAFIAGVLPLVFASGAGAEVRHVMGVTVFFGMLGVTFFGLFFTPVFYVVIRTLVERRKARQGALVEESSHA